MTRLEPRLFPRHPARGRPHHRSATAELCRPLQERRDAAVTVVGLCFGVSLLTVKLGYSVALGAFLIGAIIAEARQILKIETLMHPVRDLFSAVFFVSIGLLIDPHSSSKYAGPILAITVVVVVGKVVACSLGTLCRRQRHAYLTARRDGTGADRRIFLHHRRARLTLSLNASPATLFIRSPSPSPR